MVAARLPLSDNLRVALQVLTFMGASHDQPGTAGLCAGGTRYPFHFGSSSRNAVRTLRHFMTGRILFWRHADLDPVRLRRFMVSGVIILAGNEKLRIYGQLSCGSGKRMLRGNRVFFADEGAALDAGFRPCGHCMQDAYLCWRQGRATV